MGELGAGSTTRRWLPEGGEPKLREKIRKESKFADDYKNLPYTFSKPTRNKGHKWFECEDCGKILSAPKDTIMVVCRGCGNASKVKEYRDEVACMDDSKQQV